MTMHSFAASACAALVILMATRAEADADAQSSAASSALEEAERAYQSVDLTAALDAAERGLLAGGATLKETARLHVLAGTVAALLEQHDPALKHFTAALAIDPRLNSEQDISPKFRAPYMEALGYWATHDPRLSLTVKHDGPRNRLSFSLVDPAQLVQRVKFHVREAGAAHYYEQEVSRSKRGYIPLRPSAVSRGGSFYAEAVDTNDNCVAEFGSEDEPGTIGGAAKSPVSQLEVDAAQPERVQEHSAGQSHWLPITLLTTGAVAGAFGVYFNVRREDAAHRWNGAACENPGLSRLEQCGSVDRERSNWQTWMIASYATAGALVTSGAAILLFSSSATPRDQPRRGTAQLACSLGIETLQCQGSF